MKSLIEEVGALLRNDTTINAMVEGRIGRSGQLDADPNPKITYSEVSNIPTKYADNESHASRIAMQINIWTMNQDPIDIGIEVDRVLKGNKYKRFYTNELFETDTCVMHYIMRYRKNVND